MGMEYRKKKPVQRKHYRHDEETVCGRCKQPIPAKSSHVHEVGGVHSHVDCQRLGVRQHTEDRETVRYVSPIPLPTGLETCDVCAEEIAHGLAVHPYVDGVRETWCRACRRAEVAVR